ncbi:MAG: ATP-binding protein [Gulosibacter sp.]|uniref:ATP-binding protein n=1 Tax=Gulosibacter sp. TaxID=2817531 RepID=UPI003F8F2741
MDTSLELGRDYRPRVIDRVLQHSLEAAGAVVIEGARASGKTMTALNAAHSYEFLDAPEIQQLLQVAPRSLLEGTRPRLLDEWQIAPELWNLVRRAVDATAEPGQFILTGSALPADDVTRHTGAGRFLRLRQRTMSWWEKLESPIGSVSLAALFEGKLPAVDLAAAPSLDSVIDGILRPGFPAMVPLTLTQSEARLRGYIDDLTRTDLPRLAEVRHEPTVIRQLIAALARSVASEVTYKTLTADVQVVAPRINEATISNYVNLLQRLFIVEGQQPWAPALRSRARVRTSPKLHLVDPALAAAALGAGPEQLRRDLKTLGVLFESAVTHDLSVLASPLEGEVLHYRDSNNREIDAIISLPDGRWGAVEIKLGGMQVTAGARALEAVVAQIDTDQMGEPVFRLVLTGTGPTFVTENGIVTAPLSALAP